MEFWPQFRQWVQQSMSLDVEWTVDEDHSLTWWGWHFPQRVEYLHEPEDELPYITGRVRISTIIGDVAPDARMYVAAILNDWNQDATGAIGIMNPDTGQVHLGVAIPVTETNHPLVAQMAVGFIPRQAAYATTLARYLLNEGLVEGQQVSLAQQRHPHFGVRENPDELVRLYIDAVHDGGNFTDYDTSAVHEQVATQLQSAQPFEPGFTDLGEGIRNFQLIEDNDQFVGYRFGELPPGGLLSIGPVLQVRASNRDAAVIVHGDNPAAASAIFLTHANWHTWNEPRLPMLGAWLPGAPLGDDHSLTQVTALLPAAALPRAPRTSPPVERGTILQNLLVYVFHQANAGGPLTFRVYS